MRFVTKLGSLFAIATLLLASTLEAQVKPLPTPTPVPQGNPTPIGGTKTPTPGGSGYAPGGSGRTGAYTPYGYGETGAGAPPSGGGSTGGGNTPPSGGGTTGGTPGGGGGGSGSTPVSPPTGFGPPPGVGAPGSGGAAPTGNPPRGGETGPLGQPYSDDSWQNWWVLNEGWLLDIEQRYRARSNAREVSRDLFAGDVDPESAAPIEDRGLLVRRQTLPVLKHFLEHESVRVRAEACVAIGRTGGEDQVSWLAPMTKDKERDVRKSAIAGLGLLGQKTGLAYLEHILRDRSAPIIERAYAAVAIGMVGDKDSVPFLIERLSDGQRVQEVDASLLYGLGLIKDPRARRFLDDYTAHPLHDDVLRAVAVMGVGLQASAESFDFLAKALVDKDVRVRRSAAIALGQMDLVSSYRSEWEELETSIVRDGGEVASDRVMGELESYRARLLVKLDADEARLGKLRDGAIDLIAKNALEDSDIMVRNFALIALGELGGERALATIRGQLYEASLDSTKAFAALAMGVHGGQSAGDEVYKRLAQRSMDQQTRAAMMLALGLLNQTDAVDMIRKQFRSQGDSSVARYSAIALGLLGDEKAVEPLQEHMLSKSRPELKRAYGQALALLGDYEVIEIAGRVLRERGSVTNKVELALALAQVYDQRSLGTLLESADPKKRKDVVLAAIVRALGLLAERGDRPLTAPMFRHLNYTLRFPSLNEIAQI